MTSFLFVFINILLSLFIIVTAVLIFIVLRSDRRKITNKLFVLFVLSVAAWIFANLMANLSCFNSGINLEFWTKASLLGPIFMPILLILFVNAFPENKITLNKIYIIILALLTLGAIFLIPTRYNVKLIEISDLTTCTFNFVPGHLYTFVIFYLFGGVLISLFIVLKKFTKSRLIEKLQIKFVIIGISISILSGLFTSAVLPAFGYSQLVSIGPLSVIFFIIFTFYAITKYYLFEIRVILTQIFVGIVGMILFIQAFIAPGPAEKILGFSIFIIFSFFGYLLVRSVLKEIRRREEIEALSKELSKAYNEIKAKNVHLEKLLKMRSEFLDIASHQLRTPVSVIKGVLEMLTLGELDRLPKEIKETQLQAAFSKSKKLEQIISDILDASEMDTKPFKLNSKIARKIKVEELLERIVKTYQLEAKNKGVDLQFQKPSGPFPEILGEERYLEQAIVNLMDNAIKYTPAKNEKTKEKGKVLIKAEKDGNNIVVAVKDNGIGIPEKEMPELFEKFSRASNAKEMYTDGTGLGLFIAREIIKGHHGKMAVESKFDLGTTFKIILPIAK